MENAIRNSFHLTLPHPIPSRWLYHIQVRKTQILIRQYKQAGRRTQPYDLNIVDKRKLFKKLAKHARFGRDNLPPNNLQ